MCANALPQYYECSLTKKRYSGRFVALFWEWVRQRGREREREEIWNVQDRYSSPDTRLPFTPSSHRRPGLCGFYRCRNVSRGISFGIEKEGIKSAACTALFQICSWDRALFRFELEHTSPLRMMLEHSVLQAVHSTRTASGTKHRQGARLQPVNEFLHSAWVKTTDTHTHTHRVLHILAVLRCLHRSWLMFYDSKQKKKEEEICISWP